MIAIIGRGKVGTALARSIPRARVFSVANAARIPRGSTTFLCIPEAAIEEHAASLVRLPLRYVTVSGSMTRDAFRALGFRGVRTFHPLMGFVAGTPRTFAGIPVALDGPSLLPLARAMKAIPFRMPRDRTLYHAAAVLGGAGVLAAWSAARRLIEAAGVPKRASAKVLLPIAIAALERDALTGPIVRGDEATIRAHRRAIAKKTPQEAAVFDALVAAMRRLHEERS